MCGQNQHGELESQMESASPTFSGYRRQRKTRLSVRIGEIGSRLLITLGGIGTIIAIVLVCVFLVWVTLPLFLSPTTEDKGRVVVNWPNEPLMFGVEGDQILGWALLKDGSLISFRLDTGELISNQKLIEGVAITAVSPPSRHDQVLIGLANGTVRLGKIVASAQVLDEDKAPEALRTLAKKAAIKQQDGLAYRHENGKLNLYQVKAALEPAISLAPGKAIMAVDVSVRTEGPIYTALSSEGVLYVSEILSTKNMVTGLSKRTVVNGTYQLQQIAESGLPVHVLIDGVGNNVYLAWKQGKLQRIYCKQVKQPSFMEEVSLTEPGIELTAVQFMIGKTTLLTGDSSGRVRAWFCTKPAGFDSGDGARLEAAHELPPVNSRVLSLAASSRSRVMAASYANGSVRIANMTNELELSTLQMEEAAPDRLLIAPKENGLFAWSKAGIAAWQLQLGHHEISTRSLLRPIWYEGFTGPTYTWQSSSGDDAFEPKFSLIPLVFGTLKATFYSLLIGVPLALCAAVYSREFLHPRVRSVVKPTIEVMASLPSVVLGFLGALVIAPFVENALTPIILGFVIVPIGFAVAGFLWHTLPMKWIRQLNDKRFIFIILTLPCMILVAKYVSPSIELLLFDGDFKRWLANKEGVRSASGWLLLLLPLAGLAMVFFIGNFVNPWLRQISRQISASREAFVNLLKCILGIMGTLALAWLASCLLEWFGLDPRKSLFGVYDQRNALVVGFMMGFAIIPIIYTLAEDALTSVPDHLRSASLGCGATTWQTASRIVLPTAMSGIFSAIMVGLGRAVGETMIVLMAAGNMPVLEMNMFNGFRTLSANIAVELPEAVQGSSHFRTLFLAALTLFVLTFLLNTLAESMRQRFRKRAFEL